MRTGLFLLLLMPLAGCQTTAEPYAPVRNVRYSAIGQDPFWLLHIGDDKIVLTRGPVAEGQPHWGGVATYPRTLPRTVDGVRTWESGTGTASILIEARPGPCEGLSGRVYEDQVRVRLSGTELTGCGGRLLGPSDA